MPSNEIVDILNTNVSFGLDKYQTRDGKWGIEIYRDDDNYTSIQVYATNNHNHKTYHSSVDFELGAVDTSIDIRYDNPDEQRWVVKYLPSTFKETD